MTARHLMQLLEIHLGDIPADEDLEVQIIVREPGTIGAIPTIGIRGVYPGFDHNSGKLMIQPAEVLKKAQKPKDYKQCQWCESATDGRPQCMEAATRKYGDHWFCEEHGRRSK